jgi:hypothetical protein
MLKMGGDGVRKETGRPVKLVVLGLSHRNLERLKAGEPIMFKGEDVAVADVDFIIFSGETEASMAREMADLIGPGTRTKIDPRTTDA